MLGSEAVRFTLLCSVMCSILEPGGALVQVEDVEPYPHDRSPCRYHRIQSTNAHRWLPGLAGVGNVSLSAECQSQPQQALVSWSNGGVPWLTLTIEYYCTNNTNTTTDHEIERRMLHPIVPTLDSPLSIATDSVTVNISEALGTECSFLGCFEGDEPYLRTQFTFSTQTCRWKTETIPDTATPSRTVAYSTVNPFTSSPTVSSIMATAVAPLSSTLTLTGQLYTTPPGPSGTENGTLWFQQWVWLVVATVLTAALATLLAVVSCFLVRRKICKQRQKTTHPMFPNWLTAKLDPNFNPVGKSKLYFDPDAESIQSHHDPLERRKEQTSLQLSLINREPTELDASFPSDNMLSTTDSGIVVEPWIDLSCSGSGLKRSVGGESCCLEHGQFNLGTCIASKSVDKSTLPLPDGAHRYNEYVVVDQYSSSLS